jgi:hypothetical protein
MTTPQNPPTARCVGGSYLERMKAAITFSEESRVKVGLLTKEITAQVEIELHARHKQLNKPAPTRAQILAAVDAACSRNNRWSLTIADEQWGGRLTQMYASAELVSSTRESVQVLKSLCYELRAANQLASQQVAEQQTTNDLLKMLVGLLAAQTGLPDPPASSQRVGD